MNSSNKNNRIAIIGAGPAGLGAAEALREKGYTKITIFEKNKRVGGLSYTCTYTTPDQRSFVYDIGSVQPLSSRILLRLLKKHELSFGRGHLKNRSKVLIAYDYKNKREVLDFVKYYFGLPWRDLPFLFLDVLKFSRYFWRYRRLRKPGFYQFSYWDETTVNFKKWVEDRRFYILGERLSGLMGSLMTFSNQQDEKELTVFTTFKFLYQMLKQPVRYINGTYRPVREGYQELWKRAAQQFDTRLNTTITSILRDERGVHISTLDGAYDFDQLIISCPFDKIQAVLDVKPVEKKTFRDIKYHPGFRGAFVAKNGPLDGIYWYPESYKTSEAPPYLALVIPEAVIDETTCLYSCAFAHCPETENVVPTLQRSAEQFFFQQYGADITKWINMHYWADYGGYFGPEAVKNRVYDNIQNMQGASYTYYAGQLISFGTHASVVDYSYDLIKRFF